MIAKLPAVRARRAFSAAEFAALEAAGVFVGYPDAAWSADDIERADDGSPYCFSVEQYHRMIDAALLTPDDKAELIEGEILIKMPIGDPHAACVDILNELFILRAATHARVRVQNPVVLTYSEPEPDLSVVERRADNYRSGKPTAADTFLVVEVAESSLDFDLGRKARIYAENDIAEYWVVDLAAEQVHVHRGPQSDGTWAAVTVHGRGESLTVAALPGLALGVGDLLP